MEHAASRLSRRLAAALAVTASALRIAAAEHASEPVRLSFHAPPECPGEAEFFAELTARTRRLRPAKEGEPARRFEVTVSAADRRHRAHLRVENLDGSATTREVRGATCEEVVTAVALITAVTVDPDASTSPLPKGRTPEPTAKQAAPTPVATRSVAESQPPPAAAMSAPAPPRVDPPAIVADSRPFDEVATAEPTTHARWTAGATAQAMLGLMPEWAPGGGLFIDRSLPRSASFRASFFAASTDATFSDNVGADLLWLFLRLEACPLHLRLIDGLGIRPCLALDSGALRIRGRGLDNPNTEIRLWIAAGAFGRLQWALISDVEVELGAGILIPALRYPFRYFPADQSPALDIYVIPAVAAALTLGVGYRFQ